MAPSALGLEAMSRYGQQMEAWRSALPDARIHVLPTPGEVAASDVLLGAHRALGLAEASPDDVDAPVFQGLRRRLRSDGLWAQVGQPGLASPVGPSVVLEGREWTRLVTREEIDALTARLAADTGALSRILAAMGAVHPAFKRWPSWPSPAS
jgi:hypothetical protein